MWHRFRLTERTQLPGEQQICLPPSYTLILIANVVDSLGSMHTLGGNTPGWSFSEEEPRGHINRWVVLPTKRSLIRDHRRSNLRRILGSWSPSASDLYFWLWGIEENPDWKGFLPGFQDLVFLTPTTTALVVRGSLLSKRKINVMNPGLLSFGDVQCFLNRTG